MGAVEVNLGQVATWRVALEPLRIPMILTVALLGLAQVWSILSGTRFDNTVEPLRFFFVIVLAASISLAFSTVVVSRGDIRRGAAFERVGQLLGFVALAGATTLALGVLSYLAARLTFPYQDSAFTYVDTRLGFHWLEWKSWVDVHPWLRWVLSLAYASYAWQIAIVFVVLAVLPDRKRSLEAFCAFAFAGFVADLVSGVLPAMGAAPHLAGTIAVWTPALEMLRVPGPLIINMDQVEGIVSLPSFHTAVAVIITWSVRRTWAFSWLVGAINVVMIVSTLTEGGHYLVDVIAGLALAALSIVLAHRVVYRPVFEPAPANIALAPA